jgi:hypothetical protein
MIQSPDPSCPFQVLLVYIIKQDEYEVVILHFPLDSFQLLRLNGCS